MSLVRRAKRLRRALQEWLSAAASLRRLQEDFTLVREQTRFLLFEAQRLNEAHRQQAFAPERLDVADRTQTRASFDYQWRHLADGAATAEDPEFMRGAAEQVCAMVDRSREWFAGRSALDLGCGGGRFTLALLSLGARVTACDQSASALERTAARCAAHAERLTLRQVDLLTWDEPAAHDLVLSFGVVHHTGNTYLAIRNAAAKVGRGGRLFLMVYGIPSTLGEFQEVNRYEDLRRELRSATLEEKRRAMLTRFGSSAGHGYFDAVSPRINDLLAFEELREVLERLGLVGVRRTVDNRNLFVIADRPA